MESSLEKRRLRKRIKQIRQTLSEPIHREMSAQICAQIRAWPRWTAAHTVMAYWPMPGEVNLRPLLQDVLASGRNLLLPRCRPDRQTFETVQIRNLETELVPGPLPHLRDPCGNLPVWPGEIAIQLILVPGLAFDDYGNRLGYGRGMYDRFLEQHDKAFCIAPLFPFQLVEEVPVDAWDRPVCHLALPSGILAAGSSQSS